MAGPEESTSWMLISPRHYAETAWLQRSLLYAPAECQINERYPARRWRSFNRGCPKKIAESFFLSSPIFFSFPIARFCIYTERRRNVIFRWYAIQMIKSRRQSDRTRRQYSRGLFICIIEEISSGSSTVRTERHQLCIDGIKTARVTIFEIDFARLIGDEW